jgi:hypothetical protein
MIRQWLCLVVVLAMVMTLQMDVLAFQSSSMAQSELKPSAKSDTALFGLLGRFRNKRKVDQGTTIRVGDKLPTDVDVERLVMAVDFPTTEARSEPVSILDVLGPNKALLIGTRYLCWFLSVCDHLESHAMICCCR